jgi:D-beta-D-heptose 7-phosphate kinase/D-beta-D-heptose 1-phosphate adenosyltransferase
MKKNITPPSPARIRRIVGNLAKQRIAVVGDIMIDEYLWGDVSRISPEAPVPVVRVESVSARLGGAANVAQNLRSLKVGASLVSVCGSDNEGERLLAMLKKIGCSTTCIHKSTTRPTTVKTRIVARQQHVIRVDREQTSDLTSGEAAILLKGFLKTIKTADAVILSDYAKGVVSPGFIASALDICKQNKLFIAIDPKDRHFEAYRGVSIITPNLKEAHSILGLPIRHCSDTDVCELGWRIIDLLDLPYLLITLSERGIALFERTNRTAFHLPTRARTVFDVTGAGDTVISVFAAALAAGAKPVEAAFIANAAAGLTVAEVGTACVVPDKLIEACLSEP